MEELKSVLKTAIDNHEQFDGSIIKVISKEDQIINLPNIDLMILLTDGKVVELKQKFKESDIDYFKKYMVRLNGVYDYTIDINELLSDFSKIQEVHSFGKMVYNRRKEKIKDFLMYET